MENCKLKIIWNYFNAKVSSGLLIELHFSPRRKHWSGQTRESSWMTTGGESKKKPKIPCLENHKESWTTVGRQTRKVNQEREVDVKFNNVGKNEELGVWENIVKVRECTEGMSIETFTNGLHIPQRFRV